MAGARDSFAPAMRLPRRLTALALLFIASCGGARFDGAVYRGDGFAFRVPAIAPTWTRVSATGTGLAFHDDQRGTIAVNGRCGLDGDDVPLSALTQHLFLQFTDRSIEHQETVAFDGREAMHSILSAKLDGVANKFDVWVLKKDGCVYDLYYFAPPEHFDAGQPHFDEFARGFATVPHA
jgi:hypothetical protein